MACPCEYCEQRRKLQARMETPWTTGLLIVGGIVLPVLVILGAIAAFAVMGAR